MATQTPLQSIVATSNVASLTFSNIPQNYTDLVVVANSATTASTSQDLMFRFNGDSGTHYSRTRLYTYHVSGASWQGDIAGNQTFIGGAWSPGTNMSAGNYGLSVANFMNYSNTNMYKNVITSMNIMGTLYADNNIVGKCFGVWRGITGSSTEAINSITVAMASGNIAAGSTFDLYGVGSAAMTSPSAIGGSIIGYDNSYIYHAFTASGTFTPLRTISADVLTIAGGGGGGKAGGGGGAGAVIYNSGLSLTANTSYTVTVGGGGAGDTTRTNAAAASGSASVFGSTSATGGGGGASNNGNIAGGNGGSGGGGVNTGAGGTANAGTLNGGTGYVNIGGTSTQLGQGGGGAGAAGGTQTGSVGGVGGVGTSLFSAWGLATGTGELSSTTYYYAGGGGGYSDNVAAGGLGGGGSSGISAVNGLSGKSNTGGGGGASRDGGAAGTGNGGQGGSGLVIVRYAR
jgi:hypothetical protein